jgi:hypothetical protein
MLLSIKIEPLSYKEIESWTNPLPSGLFATMQFILDLIYSLISIL